MKVFKPEGAKVPVKSWCEDIEESALTQIQNLASLPFAFHHIALAPDVHFGFGMPIGGILATNDVVIPNAVGVDVGCGMCAMKTSLQGISKDDLKNIMGEIRKVIPVGSNRRKESSLDDMPSKEYDWEYIFGDEASVVDSQFAVASYQLGSLGSGNHFIEIQLDNEGFVWIMLHSGSRNLGKRVCDYYNNLAKDLNKRYYSSIPVEYDLAFIPLDSSIGKQYLAEMNFCLKFALANRYRMMQDITTIFQKHFNLPAGQILGTYSSNFDDYNDPIINIHHNYAAMENHFGKNVIVHRKGATSAKKGQIGIVPGSMGTKSYIVRGKGNPDSFMSCSHGAGRCLSRTKAKKELDLAAEIKRLDDQGIVHGIRHKDDLEEAAGAYKNIEDVMRQQEDLVEILVELTPLGVIKG